MLATLPVTTPHTCLRDIHCDDCPECRAEFEAGLVYPYDPDRPSPDDEEWWALETRDESSNPIDLSRFAGFDGPEHQEAVEMFGHRAACDPSAWY